MRTSPRAWLPEASLEIRELDDDHQRLLQRVNALIAAVWAKETADAGAAVDALRAETVDHFVREEKLMRDARYPEYERHRARHQRLLKELVALRFVVEASGRLAMPLPLARYIERWFVAHIGHDDRKAAAYLDGLRDQHLFGLA